MYNYLTILNKPIIIIIFSWETQLQLSCSYVRVELELNRSFDSKRLKSGTDYYFLIDLSYIVALTGQTNGLRGIIILDWNSFTSQEGTHSILFRMLQMQYYSVG